MPMRNNLQFARCFVQQLQVAEIGAMQFHDCVEEFMKDR
jgi:hypothetical protein